MARAPSVVDARQLEELHLEVVNLPDDEGCLAERVVIPCLKKY